MSFLLSIDPGASHYGLALWHERRLRRAWFQRRDRDYPLWNGITEVVCERPQVYLQNLKAANDMVTLALSAGQLIGRVAETHEPEVTFFLPSQWKGQLPKGVHHARIGDALYEHEFDRVELPSNKKHQLDVWDAVGLGLFHLKRIGRGGVRRSA